MKKKVDFVQISQIVANLGVIVGIIFLVFEVREASNATRLQSETLRVEGYNALTLSLATNPELARIFVIGLDDPDRLEDVEAAQFAALMRATMNQANTMLSQYSLGLISPETWQYAAQQFAQLLSTAGGQEYLRTNPAYSGSPFLQELEPYMGQEMQSSFSLGRSPANF